VTVHSRPPIIGSGKAGREAAKYVLRTHQNGKHKGKRPADIILEERRAVRKKAA
jgi:hypothetical protein